ncbi:hypothetical protein PG996_015951 [Apiospora saccharicola]|uniref:C2H2-type domain-containing protein n=1 Tax=Apiospora saccharicola TaxID=335842 RepID=A0ABR1TN77_9PEZI
MSEMDPTNYNRRMRLAFSQPIDGVWGGSMQENMEILPLHQFTDHSLESIPNAMLPNQLDALRVQRYLHYEHNPSVFLEYNLSSGLFLDNTTYNSANYTGLANLNTLSPCHPILMEQPQNYLSGNLMADNFLNDSHIAGSPLASNRFRSNPVTTPLPAGHTLAENASDFTGNIYGTVAILPGSISYDNASIYLPPVPSIDYPTLIPTYGWDSEGSIMEHTVLEPMLSNMMGTAQHSPPDMASSYVSGPISPQSDMNMVEEPPTVSPTSTPVTASGSSTPDSDKRFDSSDTPLSSEQDSPEGASALPSMTRSHYPKRCARQQQIRTQPRKRTCLCPVVGCDRQNDGFDSTRDLNRHLWSNHEDYAEEHDTPSELRKCGVPGCSMVCRKDNLRRHQETVHKIKKSQGNKRGRKGKLTR